MVGFVTIYLPLWVLSFISICIYFTNNNYNDKLASIAVLTLAFIPTFEIVREQTPKISSIVYIECMVVFQLFFSLLNVYLFSYNIRDGRKLNIKDDIIHSKSFLITILFTVIFSFLIPLGSIIVYSIIINNITKD